MQDTNYIPDSLLKLQKLNLTEEERKIAVQNNPNANNIPTPVLDEQSLANILQVVLNPEIVLEIITALDNNIINPNFLLTKSISNIKDERNLISIALALRYGANPNLYVSVPNIGVVHVLVYIFIKLYGNVPDELVNTIFSMMIHSKSNPMLPAIDSEAGGVKSIFEAKREISVISWISERGVVMSSANLNTILALLKHSPNAPPSSSSSPVGNNSMGNNNCDSRTNSFEQLDKIGVYLDRPDLIRSPVEISTIIQYHSNTVLEEKKNRITQTEFVLSETVKYLNLEAFSKILSLNSNVSYFFVNDLLIRMKIYYSQNFLLPFNRTKTMLLMLIERGIKLDPYQLDILKNTGEKNTKEITEIYQRPYWQKILNYSGPNDSQRSEIPFDLRILAYSLGLNYNANIKVLIEQIRQISFTDPIAYKTAFIRRQMSRISTNSSTPLDFINEPKLEKYIARNTVLLKKDNKDPYEYNELDIGVFKDSNEVVWIFTSDMFDQIINTKKNSYTNDILPNDFLDGLKMKRSLVKRLGFNVGRSLTINDGLERMNKQDVINNEENNRIMSQFEQLSLVHGITEERLRSLTYQQKVDILALHKIRINNLSDYQPEHQYIIFCRGCLLYIQSISSELNFSSKLEEFFSSIRNI